MTSSSQTKNPSREMGKGKGLSKLAYYAMSAKATAASQKTQPARNNK